MGICAVQKGVIGEVEKTCIYDNAIILLSKKEGGGGGGLVEV